MAKDPAFLFYPGDWNLGTMHLTLLEKGCYIELLILQFAKGKFTEAQAKHMLNGSFDLAWANLKDKFSTDGTFYWNERLKLEKEKRQQFTESRRINALHPKKSNKNEKHMLEHMEDENINKNEDDNVLRIVAKNEKWNPNPGAEMMDLDLNEVKAGAVRELFKFSKNHNLTIDELKLLWSIFKAQNFTGEKFYASKNDVYSHFINWSKTQKVDGQSTSNQQKANGTNYKTAGQSVYADRLKEQLSSLNR